MPLLPSAPSSTDTTVNSGAGIVPAPLHLSHTEVPSLMYTTTCLEDVFMYADVEKIELTEIDTVRATVTVRGTGSSITVEDDDIDLVANELMRKIDKQVWLVGDICRDYDISLDELRDLVMNEVERDFGFTQTYGFADGYAAGYEDGKRYSAHDFDYEISEMIDYAESRAYDEGYIAGLNDGLDAEFADSSTFSDEPITHDYDNYPEAWAPLDAIEAEPDYALAAQPVLARDPETDDFYLAYRIED